MDGYFSSLLSNKAQISSTTLLYIKDDIININFPVSKTASEFLTQKFTENKFNTNNLFFKFSELENIFFTNNLRAVDGDLPLLFAFLVMTSCAQSKTSKFIDLCAIVEKINPLEVDIGTYPNYYQLKIKRLLMSFALGLSAKKPWNHSYEISKDCLAGNELMVLYKTSLFNPHHFEDCLFNNSELEIFNVSGCNNGMTSTENGEFKLKLNLQIRFSH